MRCLRSITDMQQLAHVYLSIDNYNILDDELKKSFNIDIKEATSIGSDCKKDYLVQICEPVKILNLEEIERSYDLIEKNPSIPFIIP